MTSKPSSTFAYLSGVGVGLFAVSYWVNHGLRVPKFVETAGIVIWGVCLILYGVADGK